jgi:hypothetical protein
VLFAPWIAPIGPFEFFAKLFSDQCCSIFIISVEFFGISTFSSRIRETDASSIIILIEIALKDLITEFVVWIGHSSIPLWMTRASHSLRIIPRLHHLDLMLKRLLPYCEALGDIYA